MVYICNNRRVRWRRSNFDACSRWVIFKGATGVVVVVVVVVRVRVVVVIVIVIVALIVCECECVGVGVGVGVGETVIFSWYVTTNRVS